MAFYLCFDLVLALALFLTGWGFVRSQGRAARFLTGYNRRDPADRVADEAAMCRAYGRRMLAMAATFLLGALLDAFWAPAGCALAWAAFLAQLILLLRLRTRWEDGS